MAVYRHGSMLYMLPGSAKISRVQDILRILPYRVVQPMFPLVTPTEPLGLFLAAAPDAALPVPSVYFYIHLFTPYSLPMQFITNRQFLSIIIGYLPLSHQYSH